MSLSVAVTAANTNVVSTIAVVAMSGRENEGTAGAGGGKAIVIITFTFAIPGGDKSRRRRYLISAPLNEANQVGREYESDACTIICCLKFEVFTVHTNVYHRASCQCWGIKQLDGYETVCTIVKYLQQHPVDRFQRSSSTAP